MYVKYSKKKKKTVSLEFYTPWKPLKSEAFFSIKKLKELISRCEWQEFLKEPFEAEGKWQKMEVWVYTEELREPEMVNVRQWIQDI